VYGNAHIADLRETYGPGFAPGINDSEKLIDVLHQIDDRSLRHLVHDHGKLLSYDARASRERVGPQRFRRYPRTTIAKGDACSRELSFGSL
jgi:hypothetical protein